MGFSLVRRHCIALGLLGALALANAPAAAAPPTALLVLGDSLSAEYGLPRGSGWVALLEQRLQQQKKDYRVVNASISGDTTAGGRSRLPALLEQHHPAVVVIELGGNDALRGLPLAQTHDNLLAMASTAQARGARVLIAGMRLPPNYGQAYGAQFEAVFAEVARERKAALVPFLLKGVADTADPTALFQSDRIHPVAAAHPTILDTVWAVLKKLI